MRHYFNDLLCAAAPENGAAQNAIETALVTGRIRTTGCLTHDTDAIRKDWRSIMAEFAALPPLPDIQPVYLNHEG